MSESSLPESVAATAQFIALAQASTSFLKGDIGAAPPGWHSVGQDNSAALDALHFALRARFPQGGRPFWAVRLWTNLLWQPAYLAVIAVHEWGALPDLAGLSQRVNGSDIDGYRLRPALPMQGSTAELIDRAGAQVRAMSEIMLAEVNGYEKLKRLPARRLLADRLLGLMVRLSRQRPDLPAASIQAYSARWLAALGLTGQGDLEALPLPDGRIALVVARKGCCLDYLVDPGTYCATCPKQGDDVRRARQLG